MRVLIVDDDPDVSALLTTTLSLLDIEATTVASGVEALRALDGHLPDLIILDVQMPGMDGWQTLTRIRGSERTADIPVLMCTVKRPLENQDAPTYLADGYLTKPFAMHDLITALDGVAAKASSAR